MASSAHLDLQDALVEDWDDLDSARRSPRRYATFIRARGTNSSAAVAAQRRELAEYCASRGGVVVEEHVHEGSSTTASQVLAALVDRCWEDRFDAVVAVGLDRFSRNVRDLVSFIEEMQTYGVDLETVRGPLPVGPGIPWLDQDEMARVSARLNAAIKETRRRAD